jgi:hypothetical protein
MLTPRKEQNRGASGPRFCAQIQLYDSTAKEIKRERQRRYGRHKRKSTASPARPGCQVDHIVPLAKCGPDAPGKMQALCDEALREKEANELR